MILLNWVRNYPFGFLLVGGGALIPTYIFEKGEHMKIKIEDREINTTQALIIAHDDDAEKIVVTVADGMAYPVLMDYIGTLALHVMNVFSQLYPDAKEDLYDDFNMVASNVLASFIPDKELRPDVSMEAILKAEEDIINTKYKNLSEEEKKEAKKKIDEIKENL